MKKSVKERIAELQEKKQRLHEQERSLLARQAQEERRERQRRIFRLGSSLEEALGRPFTEEELQQMISEIRLIRNNDEYAEEN